MAEKGIPRAAEGCWLPCGDWHPLVGMAGADSEQPGWGLTPPWPCPFSGCAPPPPPPNPDTPLWDRGDGGWRAGVGSAPTPGQKCLQCFCGQQQELITPQIHSSCRVESRGHGWAWTCAHPLGSLRENKGCRGPQVSSHMPLQIGECCSPFPLCKAHRPSWAAGALEGSTLASQELRSE